MTCTATVQVPSPTSVAPAIGTPFTVVPVGGGTALPFKVSEVGQKFTANGETKFNISGRQRFATGS